MYPMSQVMEDMTKLVKHIPQDWMQNRMFDVPVPQIQEEIVQVMRFVPQKRIPEGIVEQIVDVSEPQIRVQHVEILEGHLSRALATAHSGRDCGDAFCAATQVPTVPEAEKCRDRDEANKVKIKAKSRYCAKHPHRGTAHRQV